ncbi:hypothetical protein PROFUN_09817 [Planoprotostelium fungivorum]|uniref:Uncharacterized protein n=1 Tax=Planoprotostelium fungivorum TaxID=1890364 RepID=A0A2P6NFM7_9EUKA|nr:hypothetical protein PROFUN_09817 [Planoprotostelium fungivorum]
MTLYNATPYYRIGVFNSSLLPLGNLNITGATARDFQLNLAPMSDELRTLSVRCNYTSNPHGSATHIGDNTSLMMVLDPYTPSTSSTSCRHSKQTLSDSTSRPSLQ